MKKLFGTAAQMAQAFQAGFTALLCADSRKNRKNTGGSGKAAEACSSGRAERGRTAGQNRCQHDAKQIYRNNIGIRKTKPKKDFSDSGRSSQNMQSFLHEMPFEPRFFLIPASFCKRQRMRQKFLILRQRS